jgi:parallel beta-helix repeat protein
MGKKSVYSIVLFVVLMGVLGVALNVHKVEAPYPIIYIKADGSIDPATANVTSSDNVTYTFTADINASIVVQKDNIVVDGAGYTVQGGGDGTGIDLSGRSNVTIKNMRIKAFNYGIYLYSSSNNTILGNTITNNWWGIYLDSSSDNNTLTGNNVEGNPTGIRVGGSMNNVVSGNNVVNNTNGIDIVGVLFTTISRNHIAENNQYGIILDNASNNTISANNIKNNDLGIFYDGLCNNNTAYHNNFIDNVKQVEVSPGDVDAWDDGVEGNYWSDFAGVDVDGGGDGISDDPYIITSLNTDNHPLMGPVSFFDADTWNEKTYYVHTVSNSTVSDFNFSQSNKVVSFNVTGSNGAAGFCRVTIPRELLWCEDISYWTVRVNGTVVPIRIQEYANYTYLYFTYSHSVQNVKVYGTHVIPEFSALMILPLFMIATLLAGVVHRRKCKRQG